MLTFKLPVFIDVKFTVLFNDSHTTELSDTLVTFQSVASCVSVSPITLNTPAVRLGFLPTFKGEPSTTNDGAFTVTSVIVATTSTQSDEPYTVPFNLALNLYLVVNSN